MAYFTMKYETKALDRIEDFDVIGCVKMQLVRSFSVVVNIFYSNIYDLKREKHTQQ